MLGQASLLVTAADVLHTLQEKDISSGRLAEDRIRIHEISVAVMDQANLPVPTPLLFSGCNMSSGRSYDDQSLKSRDV